MYNFRDVSETPSVAVRERNEFFKQNEHLPLPPPRESLVRHARRNQRNPTWTPGRDGTDGP